MGAEAPRKPHRIGSGRRAKEYGLAVHGKQLTADHINAVEESEIEKLYARYDGAAMTKTLESEAIRLYAGVVSMFLPIPAENQPGLVADLEGEPFIRHGLALLPASSTTGMAGVTPSSTVNLAIDAPLV